MGLVDYWMNRIASLISFNSDFRDFYRERQRFISNQGPSGSVAAVLAVS